MGILSRDQILSTSDLKTKEVKVPEWGGSVLVRSLTGAERDLYEQSVVQGAKDNEGNDDAPVHNVRARLVAVSIVDEDGSRAFSLEDVDALGQKNANALNRVFNVARKLSGLTEADVEELEGNSGPPPDDGSTTS